MALILVDKQELLEHAYRDKLDSRELIAKMIENAPTVKAIPVESIEMLLKGMRIGVANDREEVIESCGNGTGIEDYYKGYISAVSYIEGWLAENEYI